MDPTPSNSTESTPENPVVAEGPVENTEVINAAETLESTTGDEVAEIPETPMATQEQALPDEASQPATVATSAEESIPTFVAPQVSESNSSPNDVPLIVPAQPFVPAGEPIPGSDLDPGHTLSIAALVLSIIGIHVVGLILGIVAIRKSKKAGYKNNLALAAIIVSGVGFVFVTACASLILFTYLFTTF